MMAIVREYEIYVINILLIRERYQKRGKLASWH